MKSIITLTVCLFIVSSLNSEAQTLTKKKATEIADFIWKRAYGMRSSISQITYDAKTGVWTCADGNVFVGFNLIIELRDQDLHYRKQTIGLKKEKFRISPKFRREIRGMRPKKS